GAQVPEREACDAVEPFQRAERLLEHPVVLVTLWAKGGDDEDAQLGSAAREAAEQMQCLCIGPVEVVEHEQQRLHLAHPPQDIGYAALQREPVGFEGVVARGTASG